VRSNHGWFHERRLTGEDIPDRINPVRKERRE
jgi:hypothetical protein